MEKRYTIILELDNLKLECTADSPERALQLVKLNNIFAFENATTIIIKEEK